MSGFISATKIVPSDGTVNDAKVADSPAISVTKLVHLHKPGTNFGLKIGDAPVSAEFPVFIASGACAIRAFKGVLQDCGTNEDIDFDLKINGVSALTGVLNMTHADTDKVPKTGTLSTATLAAGDNVTISCTATTVTTAKGPFAWLEIAEGAN